MRLRAEVTVDCRKESDNRYYFYNSLNRKLWGGYFDDYNDCHARSQRVDDGMICSRQGDQKYIVDVVSGLPLNSVSFDSLSDCFTRMSDWRENEGICLFKNGGIHLFSPYIQDAVYGSKFSEWDDCKTRLSTIREKAVCKYSSTNKYRIASMVTGKALTGDIGDFSDCQNRLAKAVGGFVCSRRNSVVNRVNILTGERVSHRYASLEECFEHIENLSLERDTKAQQVPDEETQEYLRIVENIEFGKSYPLISKKGDHIHCGTIALLNDSDTKRIDYIYKTWHVDEATGECFNKIRYEIDEKNSCLEFSPLFGFSNSEIGEVLSTVEDLNKRQGFNSISLGKNRYGAHFSRCSKDGEPQESLRIDKNKLKSLSEQQGLVFEKESPGRSHDAILLEFESGEVFHILYNHH